MNYREQKRQEEISRRQMWRYDERNRIKDARRGQALMQARIDDLMWRGMRSIFMPPMVQDKSAKVALVLGLLFGPFALPIYLHSFGTFVRWFFFAATGAIAGFLLAGVLLARQDRASFFAALIIGWSVPDVIAAGYIMIRKL